MYYLLRSYTFSYTFSACHRWTSHRLKNTRRIRCIRNTRSALHYFHIICLSFFNLFSTTENTIISWIILMVSFNWKNKQLYKNIYKCIVFDLFPGLLDRLPNSVLSRFESVVRYSSEPSSKLSNETRSVCFTVNNL